MLTDARGVVIDPEVYTVHDVTGTLKLFFRSLPDPLLTHQLYDSFIATMRKLPSLATVFLLIKRVI